MYNFNSPRSVKFSFKTGRHNIDACIAFTAPVYKKKLLHIKESRRNIKARSDIGRDGGGGWVERGRLKREKDEYSE